MNSRISELKEILNHKSKVYSINKASIQDISKQRIEFIRNNNKLPTIIYMSNESHKKMDRSDYIFGMRIRLNLSLPNDEFIIK